MKRFPIFSAAILYLGSIHAESGFWEEQVATTCAAFIASLTPEQKSIAVIPFQDDERENWHYVPMDRKGIRIDALNEKQQSIVNSMLTASLSESGKITAEQVQELEAYLYEKSNQDAFRDPKKYFITIFKPQNESFTHFGWRFEGHHLSLNFTYQNGSTVLTTPFFFGTNPAEVPEGPKKGLRPLGEIEDLARDIARNLHHDGLHVRFTNEAPREILSRQSRTATSLPKEGIRYQELTAEQKKQFAPLVHKIAAHQRFLKVTEEQLESTQFAWGGSFEKGEPHYFRIQSAIFLIEYANSQNRANHAHLFWRNFKDDFGRDLLKEHLHQEHSGTSAHN